MICFSLQELNFISVFGGRSKAQMIEDIRSFGQHLEDEEMLKLSHEVIQKLEHMSNKEFSASGLETVL